MTLAELLFAPEREPDPAVALVHGPGDVVASWDDVQRRARNVAAALREAGVQVGEAVGVMLPNGSDVVAALFGVWRAGAVYVPLNPRATSAEVTHALEAAAPAAVVTSPTMEDRSAEARWSLPTVLIDGDRIVVIDPATEPPHDGDSALPVSLADLGVPDAPSSVADPAGAADSTARPPDADLVERPPATGPAGPADRGGPERRGYGPDVALVQFTSGTTGRPKPVLLTHSGVLTLLDNVLAKLRGGSAGSGSGARQAGAGRSGAAGRRNASQDGSRAPMPNLVPVSLSLWAGIYQVLFALRVGAPVVVMDGFDPLELVRLVQRHGIRSTVLPPAAMVALVDEPQVTDLAPLRFVRSITAPLSPLQARRFNERFGIAVLNSYGQTEIGGEIVGWNAADSRAYGDTKLGSVGRPHAGVQLRIVAVAQANAVVEANADAGAGPGGVALTDVPPGEAGELWVRTPAMSAGYADGRSLGDRLTPDGWFRTGDVARIDADGFVWIEGRVSDMINRGGFKVYPAEVEEVLRTSAEVADAAVVAVPDPRLGEVPYAFVVPTPGASSPPDPDALERLCRVHLAPYKVPVAFELVDALLRNDVGKVLKTDLAAQAATRLRTRP